MELDEEDELVLLDECDDELVELDELRDELLDELATELDEL